VDSSKAAAKAAPCKILRRISANLMNALAAKIAPQGIATDTNVAFLFSRPVRGIPNFLIIRLRQPSSTSRGT
jgi:hypothetical protein